MAKPRVVASLSTYNADLNETYIYPSLYIVDIREFIFLMHHGFQGLFNVIC
ncbi:MAG: hypothetical protein FD131_2157 [Rhodocyclaceae bacterium]|nr:MAG: hypothetical protein FD131_2157 [Rhodocyclaceae bacterium]